MNHLAELLADCDACGIRLLPASNGGLAINAPQDTLTPDLLNRLKAHKSAILSQLQAIPSATFAVTSAPAKSICRCGSTVSRDIPIHDGQSQRRECARCGRFLNFPNWYGNNTCHNDK